jgi:hypothetical protein
MTSARGDGKVAQCSERIFGLVFLIQRDADHHADEAREYDAVERFGEQEVQDTGADQ